MDPDVAEELPETRRKWTSQAHRVDVILIEVTKTVMRACQMSFTWQYVLMVAAVVRTSTQHLIHGVNARDMRTGSAIGIAIKPSCCTPSILFTQLIVMDFVKEVLSTLEQVVIGIDSNRRAISKTSEWRIVSQRCASKPLIGIQSLY